MPPKAARGRGRPRGARGARGAAASGTAPPPPAEDAPAETAPDSQTAPDQAPSSQPAAPQAITPQNELNSPNSSPASIPTETPAPTPVRAPIQRNVASGSGSGSKPAAAASKFKPRVIRRGQAEREQLAQEAEKKRVEAEKLAEAARLRAAGVLSARGAKSGRSRGGMMGRGRDTGLFGVTPQALQHAHRPMDMENVAAKTNYGSGGSGLSDFFKTEGGESSRAGGHSGGHGGGGGHGGRGGGGGGSRVNIKYEPQYPDLGDEDAPRFNIEDINRPSPSSLSDDEPIITGSRKVQKGKSTADEPGMRPIRLDRTEHKERVTVVNTGEEIKSEVKTDVDLTMDNSDSDVIMTDDDRSGDPGLLRDHPMPVHIKPDPDNESSLSAIAIKNPSSPEAKHSKVKRKGKEPVHIPGIDVDKKKKPATKKRDQKPDKHSTAEDIAEYARHIEDISILAEELGGMQARPQPQDDVAMGGTQEGSDKRAGRLYLFQFPGVLSKLYNPLTEKPEKSKAKGKEPEKDKDVEITSSTSNPPKKPQIKAEEGEVIIKQEDETVKKPEEVVEDIGAVGRMIVRKSGRVEFTWGDTDMVVQRGAQHSFLGAGFIIDSLERLAVGPTEGVERIGMSTSMGSMMGKFVVVPDFEETW